MDNVREQAEKAETWAEEKMRDPEFRKIAEEEFGKMEIAENALREAYTTGHAAGAEEGARRFAEALIASWTNEHNVGWYRSYLELQLADFLAATGTVRAVAPGVEDGGEEE
jgi:flagellar biosynthesis/type III secretory pathway protein FliH